jgi:hypothetical protein
MDNFLQKQVNEAKQAAIEVLWHNADGPFEGLPRTAGWGYPEPYTRDLMISSLGILTTHDEKLHNKLAQVLRNLAKNQASLGQIPSLVNDPNDTGASDTTPLFLIGLALYRNETGQPDFLEDAAQKAIHWMQYQSPDNRIMVAQQPTSDWRDEQWVLGYGLYVNTLVYIYLKLLKRGESARQLHLAMNEIDIQRVDHGQRLHEGFLIAEKPYYALWTYKVLNSERFDLLGNSLAILAGIANQERAIKIVNWIEENCEEMKTRDLLNLDLAPCLIPFILPGESEWHPRFARYNKPGEYHNGGIWPFVSGFYIAALVACGLYDLAEQKLAVLTDIVKMSVRTGLEFGFNEWFKAQDGLPHGQDWQTWSASMYLYAAACVEQRKALFFQ